MKFKIIEDLEEQYLITVFSDDSYADPDEPSKFYDHAAFVNFSKDELVAYFIEDILEGNTYEGLSDLSVSKAPILLRQMGMFRKNEKKKELVNSSTEAKQYTKELLDFLGPKTAYYTNVDAVDQPHDQPGFVTHNSDMYGHNDSICFIAVNEKYFLFIEQQWNFGGE
jgi:hypothetical protein